jgi:hypothetical protein
MNNTRDLSTYNTAQSYSPSSESTDAISNIVTGYLAANGLMIIIGIIIFIIWIWSMISMISLNTRFKDFYVAYMSEKEAKSMPVDGNESITHGERVIEPLQESDKQPKESWANKKLNTTSVITLVSLAVLVIANYSLLKSSRHIH